MTPLDEFIDQLDQQPPSLGELLLTELISANAHLQAIGDLLADIATNGRNT